VVTRKIQFASINYKTENGGKHFELYMENLKTNPAELFINKVSIVNCIRNYFLVVLVSSYRAKCNSELIVAKIEAGKI
jgi:hypothetical protein